MVSCGLSLSSFFFPLLIFIFRIVREDKKEPKGERNSQGVGSRRKSNKIKIYLSREEEEKKKIIIKIQPCVVVVFVSTKRKEKEQFVLLNFLSSFCFNDRPSQMIRLFGWEKKKQAGKRLKERNNNMKEEEEKS